jgi:hypothetical protein
MYLSRAAGGHRETNRRAFSLDICHLIQGDYLSETRKRLPSHESPKSCGDFNKHAIRELHWQAIITEISRTEMVDCFHGDYILQEEGAANKPSRKSDPGHEARLLHIGERTRNMERSWCVEISS